MSISLSPADLEHREDMRSRLRGAADDIGVTLTGEPVFGWRDRTVGSQVRDGSGTFWLRVVFSHEMWAAGDFWTGNLDASAIAGVPKPQVLRVHEWAEDAHRFRAELMILVPGRVCSQTDVLRSEIDLPGEWWEHLRQALDVLAAHPTERVVATQQDVTRRLLAFFGDRIDPTVTTWTTAHGDLQWANLTGPELCILDWEGWGMAPAGYDAAMLYCYSLLAPDTARQVHETFADFLDTPDGVRAQLHAAGRLLRRVEGGDYPDLAGPLHRHAQTLLAHLPTA